MKVKLGWSVDYGKSRFDIEVDETDLTAMLVTHGCTDPEGFRLRMDSYDVYRIMYEECQVAMSLSMADQEPGHRDDHLRAAKLHRENREKLLSRVLQLKKPSDPEPAASG